MNRLYNNNYFNNFLQKKKKKKKNFFLQWMKVLIYPKQIFHITQKKIVNKIALVAFFAKSFQSTNPTE